MCIRDRVVGVLFQLLRVVFYIVRVCHILGNAFADIDQQRAGTAGRVYVHTDFDTKEKALSGAKAAEKGLK